MYQCINHIYNTKLYKNLLIKYTKSVSNCMRNLIQCINPIDGESINMININ